MSNHLVVPFAEAFPRLQHTGLAAVAERNRRAESDEGAREPEWVLYEREQMRSATNALRFRNGLPPTAEDELRTADTAQGHCDYATKFALHCAQLAIEMGNARPA